MNDKSGLEDHSHSAGVPLTPMQEQIWFFANLEPHAPVYNSQLSVRLTGDLDLDALERALDQTVERQTALRTSIRVVGDHPRQVTTPHHAVAVERVDFSHMGPGEQQRELEAFARRHARAAFDLLRGPLFRVAVVRLSAQTHIVLLCVHHLVFDGWSGEVLLNDLARSYEQATTGGPALPALGVRFAQYAAEMRKDEREYERGMRYWGTQLAGIGPLDLPLDLRRPPIQTFEGANHWFFVPQRLADRLQEIGHAANATLFMTLLASFNVLLFRYTQQKDIVIGCPVSGRRKPEVEELVGCFINMLAVRTTLSPDLPFYDLVRSVARTMFGGLRHCDMPFARIVKEIQSVRDQSRHPVYQVLFQLRNYPRFVPPTGALRWERMSFDKQATALDLVLEATPQSDGLGCVFQYNAKLFERASIERMASHFVTLLESIATEPDTPIAALTMLTRHELHKVVYAWNDTTTRYPRHASIHQLFEEQASRTPDLVAVTDGHEELSYEQLNRRADAMARHFLQAGVGTGTLTALCMARSVEMVVAILATLKTGAAYLPISPELPAERFRFVLEDSGARALITEPDLVPRFAGTEVPVLNAVVPEDVAAPTATDPLVTVTPEDLAYVIYTSGSSGSPKGVMIPHRGLVNHNIAVSRALGMGPGDRRMQFAAIDFDLAVSEILTPLICGAAVVIWPPGREATPENVVEFIADQRVSIAGLPTALWHELVVCLKTGAELPGTLKALVVGTEAALPERLSEWQSVIGNRVRWINAYGPTETSITATIYEPSTELERSSAVASVPIGRPIANTRAYVLDETLNPTAIGVPGELYIAGDGLARGYLNRAELTESRFLEGPFPFGREQRLYRTGDLARFRSDGVIEFLGRVDRQTKIRGFRVELGEVEATLAMHPSIEEAAVIAVEAAPGDQRLAAYVVSHLADQSLQAELRGFLAQRLPRYMIPGWFVLMPALPRTPSGKVDYKTLPAAEREETQSERPATALEQQIIAIWADVLGVEHIGPNDEFFEIGGHSLAAMRIVARIRHRLGVDLPVRAIFDGATVSELAQTIQAAGAGQGKV